MSNKRQSTEPTYDHRETGDRFTVETRLNGRRISLTPCRDPFVLHRLTIGRGDLIRSLLHGRAIVEICVSGDPGIVNDVMELDADHLVVNSTRRDEWDAKVRESLAAQADGE